MKEDKPDYQFWNNSAVVAEFANNRPSIYWQSILSRLSNATYSNVLDIGCGAGRNSDLLISMGFTVYACDLNPGMLFETKKRLVEKFGVDKSKIVQASMTALPYQNNAFDMVLSNGVFHNATTEHELYGAFNESARVLRKDGLLLLSMFIADDIDQASLKQDPEPPVYITREGLKMVLYNSNQILGMLESRGLKPIGEIQIYNNTISTGERSILRTIFRKE